MAVLFPGTTGASSSRITYGGSYPTVATLSACGWVNLQTDTNTFAVIWDIEHEGVQTYTITTNTDGTTLGFGDITSVIISGVNMVVGTWYFWGVTISGGSVTLYWAKEGERTLNSATGTVTTLSSPNFHSLGEDSSDLDPLKGAQAFVRVWNVVLSKEEMTTEYQSNTPVRTEDLFAYLPLTSGAQSGEEAYYGQTWIPRGTLTDMPDPSVNPAITPRSVIPFRKVAAATTNKSNFFFAG